MIIIVVLFRNSIIRDQVLLLFGYDEVVKRFHKCRMNLCTGFEDFTAD